MGCKRVVPVVATAVFMFAAGPVFADSPTPARTPLPITIGYVPSYDLLRVVAREQKFFEKAGLAPTFVQFVAGSPMIDATQDKKIDVASVGGAPFLVGLEQGVDWAAFGISLEGAYAEGLVARKDSGIATVADLAGKKIAFVKGSNAHFGLVRMLQQLGIRQDQVTLIDMPPAAQLTALANKEIDAAMVWEPWMQRMVHEANARIIMLEGDMGIYTDVAVYAARRDWLRENRETAVRFLEALLMASQALQKQPAIGVKALARETGIKEAWAEAIYENAPPPRIDRWTDPHYRYSLVKGAEFNRRIGYLAAFLFEHKMISREVDLRNVLDASIITEALKARKAGQ